MGILPFTLHWCLLEARGSVGTGDRVWDYDWAWSGGPVALLSLSRALGWKLRMERQGPAGILAPWQLAYGARSARTEAWV